ncbi:MAG: 4Fe-4S binding protein [Candidatus Latescibacterota bacterium]|nr:4Fe-4S binding protein [Candidatus Latescibacterota bacterium]
MSEIHNHAAHRETASTSTHAQEASHMSVSGGPAEDHVMAGVPTWMAMTTVGLIIVLSHLLLRRRSEGRRSARVNLFRARLLPRLIRLSFFPALLQTGSLLLFTLITFAGLYGSQSSNIGTVLTWTWWWALLIFVIVAFGKGFCSICPWEGLASLTTSLSLRSRRKRLGFEWRWPKWARNLYPALGLFVLFTSLELGWEATNSPSMTAVMGASMAGMAAFSALVFRGRAFCRYVCPVGRISGIYALFSPVELRAKSADTCRSCATVDCVHGNHAATGCPTGLFPGVLSENTYCTMCTECIRACPHDNLQINARAPGADLQEPGKRFRGDEAVLALVLLALTSFHGLTMTQTWSRSVGWLRVQTGWDTITVFTGLMATFIATPLLLFVGTAHIARLLSGAWMESRQIAKALAYAVIPVALFYHLAHNGMHFFMEGQNLIPALSDPFGWGWDLFGTARRVYSPLLSPEAIWWIQVGLIITGHVYGVIVADRIGRQVFASSAGAVRGLTPFIILTVLYSGMSIWLIAQPMVMRSGM